MAKAKIRQSPGSGIKIDTFYFDAEQVVGQIADEEGEPEDKLIQKKVSFDLFMVKRFDERHDLPNPAATLDAGFRMYCPETKDEVFGSDVSAMIHEMRSKLDKRFRIDWKSWFLVHILPVDIYDGTGSGFKLSWENVFRGEAYDGSVLMRRVEPYARLHTSRFKVSTWPKTFVEKGKLIAAIEATEANRALLENAAAQIDRLRAMLVQLLGPELIMKTLADLANGGNLLSSSERDRG